MTSGRSPRNCMASRRSARMAGNYRKDQAMPHSRKVIPRVAPKAYEYVKQVLDFGFHNAHAVGMTARLERQFAQRFGHTYGIAHCNGTATMQSALLAAAWCRRRGDRAGLHRVFHAGSRAALQCRARDRDVDPDAWTISVDAIRSHITRAHAGRSRCPSAVCRPTWIPSWNWPKSTTWW